MNRLAAGVAAVVLCALLAAATAAATAATATPPRAQLRAFTCHRALDPPNRSMSVNAVMRPLAQTKHMAIRFDLLMSAAGGAPQRVVHSGDLGLWVTPKNATLGQLPGDVWSVQKSVIALAAPAKYRFRVMFRWTGAHNHVIGTMTRYSPQCRQRELRPDLLVRSITVTPVANHPSRDLYTAVIANDGNSAAGPFDVLFAPADGTNTKTRTIMRLRAHSSIRESFVGPDCATAGPPTITADSANQVDDLNRANNAMTATCPAAPAPKALRPAATLDVAMKPEIHPEYVEMHVRCTCGNEFVTRSTKPEIHVEICSACHPFYTGRQKLVDTGGRVERFQRRVAKGRRSARTTSAG